MVWSSWSVGNEEAIILALSACTSEPTVGVDALVDGCAPQRPETITSVNNDDEPVSKSQRKRDALALQALAEDLVQLTPSQLDGVPLSDELREAVAGARTLSRGAYRRQLRYLGRLLRGMDAEPVKRAVDALSHASHADKARLRRLERWRERLIEEGDPAVTELLEAFPEADAQSLRQLVRNARKEQAAGRPPRSFRQLFRFLSEL